MIRNIASPPGAGAPEVAARIMSARKAFREKLTQPAVSQLIEPFDPKKYNTNATVAENILFGLPIGDVFDIEQLAEHPYIRDILAKAGLSDEFLEMGKQVAQTMLELSGPDTPVISCPPAQLTHAYSQVPEAILVVNSCPKWLTHCGPHVDVWRSVFQTPSVVVPNESDGGVSPQ